MGDGWLERPAHRVNGVAHVVDALKIGACSDTATGVPLAIALAGGAR